MPRSMFPSNRQHVPLQVHCGGILDLTEAFLEQKLASGIKQYSGLMPV